MLTAFTAHKSDRSSAIIVLAVHLRYYFARGTGAKLCDEYVCVCVCLFAKLSPEPHARSLPILSMLPLAVARSSSGRVTIKYQRKWAVLGVFFPTDNALYSIAFGTHTKTAESIEMPLEMMSGLDPRNSVLRLRGVDDPRRGRGRKHVPDKPNTPIHCELDSSVQRRSHDMGRHLIASVGEVFIGREGMEGGIAHRR